MVVLVVMGVSGSGKTTIARALADEIGCRFADADDWHSNSNVAKMRSGIPLSDKDRLPWLEALHDLLKSWESRTLEREKVYSGTRKNSSETLGGVVGDDIQLTEDEVRGRGDMLCKEEVREKYQASKEPTKEDSLSSEEGATKKRSHHTPVEQVVSGVLACSALRQAYREILTGVGDSCGEVCGVDCVFVVLCGSEAVIQQRLEGRQGHYMPPSLLRSQLETLEIPTQDEGRWRLLVEDLTMSVDAIVCYVLQQLITVLRGLPTL